MSEFNVEQFCATGGDGTDVGSAFCALNAVSRRKEEKHTVHCVVVIHLLNLALF